MSSRPMPFLFEDDLGRLRLHVDQVMARVPRNQRCTCSEDPAPPSASTPSREGFFSGFRRT